MKDKKDLVKKIKIEYMKSGLFGILKKGWQKTRLYLYYSTSSILYERNIADPLPGFTPEIKLDTAFLVHDKSEIIQWLETNNDKFPWIFIKKEVDSAQANKHPYFILKHNKHIIGYIKIGIGPTYFNDFNKTITVGDGNAFIYDTFILPEYRGMNLAVYALKEVVLYLRDQGYRKVMSYIEIWNTPSIKTYEKAGFRVIELTRFVRLACFSFYLRNGFKPCLNLEKVLNSRSTTAE